jgi:pimeloyl-ACP methyl ester carboxylesterase
MVVAIARPRLEGNIAVGDDRQLGFAEFGDPQGRAIFWLHGTPGARRQIPTEARVYAEENHIRLIGIDRPGIGASTPYQYDTVVAFADDLRTVADTLGIDKMAVIGLSGGGPYTLGCAAAMPDRIEAVGVRGGIATTVRTHAISGGGLQLG